MVESTGAVGTARAYGVGARVSSWGNPYFEAVADRGRHTQDVQVLGTLFLPVDVHGQRSTRIGEADRLLDWRQMARADVQAQAMAQAVLAYGEGLVARAHVENARLQQAEARSEAAWFTARAAARDATIVDVNLALVEVSRYVQALAEAQLRLADARLRLTIYTGLDQLDEAPAAGLPIEPPGLRGSQAAATRAASQGELPMLRANQAETGFWSAARERAEAEKHAPFFLLLYGGRGDFGEARLGAGFAYTFPVARKNQGEIARADAERTRALQMRPALQRVALARLQADHASIRTALAAVREMETHGIPAAENAVNATLESFRAGKMELVRVIIARRDLATVRARRLDIIASAWKSYADMVAVLGALP